MANSRARWVGGFALTALLSLPFSILANPAGIDSPSDVAHGAGRLSFEPNLGQADRGVEFLARGGGYRMFVRPRGAEFELSDGTSAAMVFANADPAVQIEPLERLSGKVHYLVGDRPEGWLTGIPTFGGVVYQQLYPGIDLFLRGERRRVELEFTIAAGADAEQILIDLEDATDTELNGSGELVLRFEDVELRLMRPSFLQDDGAGRQFANFLPSEGGRVGFALEGFDPEKAVRLETALVRLAPEEPAATSWSDLDGALRVTTDDTGAIFLAGRVPAAPSRTEQWQQDTRRRSGAAARVGWRSGRRDRVSRILAMPTLVDQGEAFVTRIAPDGLTVLSTTYFGGRGRDVPLDIALDADGQPLVVGSTTSRDFPAMNTIPAGPRGGSDVFALKFNADATGFAYSTLIGAGGDESARGVAVDPEGQVWLAGQTSSADFPTTGDALQLEPGGGGDAFAALLSTDGTELVYSTYLGGGASDIAHGIGLDSAGSIHLAGTTTSADFPVANPLQPEHGGGSDGFVAKLAPDGSALVYSTYLGGSGNDQITGLALDAADRAHVVGTTVSADFPLLQAYQPALAGSGPGDHGDAFVAKLDGSGSSLLYATYLGGGGDDRGCDIALDAEGHAWITGITGSTDFPSVGTRAGGGSSDGFLTRLDFDGAELLRSTRLGGDAADAASAVTLFSDGDVLVAGASHSRDLPGATTLEASTVGGAGFVTRIRGGTSCPDADNDGLAICDGICTPDPGDVCGDCDDGFASCTTDCVTDVDGDTTADCADTCIDGDGDNYGDPGGAGNTCTAADCDDGFVSCTTDCTTDMDGDATADCADTCIDGDGDGYGTAGGAGNTCTAADCDDLVATCNTDCATDADGDTTADCDDDCVDADRDGYGIDGGGAGSCLGADCDDGFASCTTDCVTDVDSDTAPDCADTCLDADGDNYGDPGGAGNTCTAADCDDGNSAVNPGRSEICNDMIDNECDGLVDQADFTDCGVCQTLGNAPPPAQVDQDVWTFTGSQGEDVVLTLTAQGSDSGNAQLILVSAITGVSFSLVDTSDLPNALSGTLPADGEYRIGVLEQPPGALVPGPIFRGDYCFTLFSTQGGSATLAATASVE